MPFGGGGGGAGRVSAVASVGVDVGGTKILGAVVDVTGRVLQERATATEAEQGVTRVTERIANVAACLTRWSLDHSRQLLGVGVCVPGYVDGARGVARFGVNIPWRDCPLADTLRGRLQHEVHIENDARAGALGESRFGCGVGVRDFLYVTVGTGVGCGIVKDGVLLRGGRGAAGDLGHIRIREGLRCRCGRDGCLEAWVAGPAIVRALNERRAGCPAVGDARAVVELGMVGDTDALAVIDHAADALVSGLGVAVALVDPAKIAIGGGLAQTALWWMRFRSALKRSGWPSEITVHRATLGRWAGVVGAASLALPRM